MLIPHRLQVNTWLLGDHPDISTATVAMPCCSVSNMILKYIDYIMGVWGGEWGLGVGL